MRAAMQTPWQGITIRTTATTMYMMTMMTTIAGKPVPAV